jgi:hypothetical protein
VINGIMRLADPNNGRSGGGQHHVQWLHDMLNKQPVPADATAPPDKRVSFRPDILHFIGHGKPGALAFMRSADDIQADKDKRDDDRQPVDATRWCNATEIQGLFTNTPRLVFLHACERAGRIDRELYGPGACAQLPDSLRHRDAVRDFESRRWHLCQQVLRRNPRRARRRGGAAGREALGESRDKVAV